MDGVLIESPPNSPIKFFDWVSKSIHDHSLWSTPITQGLLFLYVYMYFSQNQKKHSQNEKSMRVPVLVYLILSQNFLHESLQKLILRLVAGLL